MEKKTSVTKFVINEKPLYVSTIWNPNENDLFHIKIYDGAKTWSGRYSYEFAKKYKERFEESEAEYYLNVKKALMKHEDFSYSFTLQTEDNKPTTFSWKKKFQDSDHGLAVLVHGSVPLHVDEVPESKDMLLDFLLAENMDLRNTIDNLNSKTKHLEVDLNRYISDLDKFVDIKTNLETSLYGKFVQLLTAKKKRIEVLEENIVNLRKKIITPSDVRDVD